MSRSGKPDNGGSQPESKPASALPDAAICRVRESGFGDYYDCLVNFPSRCSFALSYGNTFFCLNPERAAIAARTLTQPHE